MSVFRAEIAAAQHEARRRRLLLSRHAKRRRLGGRLARYQRYLDIMRAHHERVAIEFERLVEELRAADETP